MRIFMQSIKHMPNFQILKGEHYRIFSNFLYAWQMRIGMKHMRIKALKGGRYRFFSFSVCVTNENRHRYCIPQRMRIGNMIGVTSVLPCISFNLYRSLREPYQAIQRYTRWRCVENVCIGWRPVCSQRAKFCDKAVYALKEHRHHIVTNWSRDLQWGNMRIPPAFMPRSLE